MKKIAVTLFSRRFSLAGGVLLSSFIILFSAFITDSQKKYSLVFAMYDSQAAANHIVHIKKVSFISGVPGGVENIMDVVTQDASDDVAKIRFDLGANQIYKNRYVITSYGQVIDLTAKKVLVDTHDKFVRASGDSIVFYTNDIFRGQFYSFVDCKTGNYSEIKSPSFSAILGKDVEPDCSGKNYKIYYYPPSSEKVELVKDAGFGEDVSLIDKGKPQLPMYWIDAKTFLYPKYSSDHGFVSIMKFSMDSKTEEKVGDIDQLPENHSLSNFYKNADGDIIYNCSRGQFKCDFVKKKVTEQLFLSAGNGFSISVNEVAGQGRTIQNSNSPIGNYFCDPTFAVSSKGYLAFPYEIVLGQEHYLQGIQIYSTATSKWKSIGDSDLSAVIGWMEE